MATITLNNGNAVYSNTVPTLSTAASGGLSNLQPDGSTDHLFRNTWHWRINGVDTREFVFHSGAGFGFTEAGNGTNVGTQSWTGLGGTFNAVLTTTLTDGGAAGQALLVQSMAITNTGPAAISLAMFNFADYDVGGTAGTDNATLFASDIIQITDGANTVQHQGAGADAWQATAFNTLYTALTNISVGDLTNTGLPFGPGDYTGAFQWNESVGAGATVVFTSVHGINTPVPAPGGLALAGLAGLIGRRRRRD
jgi:MYXO-CTERM domain-containing protein